MRTALPCSKTDCGPVIIVALVVIATALLFITLVQALDDPIASGVLALTVLLGGVALFGAAMRKRH